MRYQFPKAIASIVSFLVFMILAMCIAAFVNYFGEPVTGRESAFIFACTTLANMVLIAVIFLWNWPWDKLGIPDD